MSDAPFDSEEIVEAFELLEEWEERYRYLIELGRKLPPLTEEEHSPAHIVEGCMSQVWLVADVEAGTPPRLIIRADSDAFIVKGLIAVLLGLFSHRSPGAILATDEKAYLESLGLGGHLSIGRRNGLESMVRRVKELAAANA